MRPGRNHLIKEMTNNEEVLRAAYRTLELNLESLETLADAIDAVAQLEPIIAHQVEVTVATLDVIDEVLNPAPLLPAPDTITATQNLASRIELSWTPVLGADAYEVTVDGVVRETTIANTLIFGRLFYGQEQVYTVRAVAGDDLGEVSAEVVGRAADRPVLLTGFGFGDVTESSVEVVWDEMPPETPGVQVHRSENGGLTWRSLTKGAIGTSFVDTVNIAAGADYTYRIRGFNDFPEPKASVWSDELVIRTLDNSTPEPPTPEPEPGDFFALDNIDNAVSQNKVLKVPAMQASRTGREVTGTLGDVKRSDWNMGDGDLIMQNQESIVPQGYSQWSSNLHKKVEVRPGDYTWLNIGVSPADGASQLKWGTREYNAPFRSFIECDFTRIPREHGLYVSNYEGTHIEDCTFLECGSQGVQFAHRPLPYQQYDADTLPYQEPPTHVCRNSHFVDNALGGDRPSYNLTYFNPGTSENPGTLLVEDCSFVAAWDEPRYDGRRSTGAMCVVGQQGNAPLSGHPMMDLITLRNNLYDYTNGDRSIISIRSCETVIIEDCAFIARDHTRPFISIDEYIDDPEVRTKRIIFRNCETRGNVRLSVHTIGGSVPVKRDINCPGRELEFSGMTGELVYDGPIRD